MDLYTTLNSIISVVKMSKTFYNMEYCHENYTWTPKYSSQAILTSTVITWSGLNHIQHIFKMSFYKMTFYKIYLKTIKEQKHSAILDLKVNRKWSHIIILYTKPFTQSFWESWDSFFEEEVIIVSDNTEYKMFRYTCTRKLV